jgi:hypothetical protein
MNTPSRHHPNSKTKQRLLVHGEYNRNGYEVWGGGAGCSMRLATISTIQLNPPCAMRTGCHYGPFASSASKLPVTLPQTIMAGSPVWNA